MRGRARRLGWIVGVLALCGCMTAIPPVPSVGPSAGPSGSPTAAAPVIPNGQLATLGFRTLQLDYPANWFVHHVTELDLGWGSTDTVLSSTPFPADCQDPTQDLNCLSRHPLEPGTVRIELGTAELDQPFFDPDPPGLPDGVRRMSVTVAGLPAVMTDRRTADGPSLGLAWQIAQPDSVNHTLAIEATATDPGAAALRDVVTAIVASARRLDAPVPVPPVGPARDAAIHTAKELALDWATDGGNVVMGDRATNALDDCFRASIDAPVTRGIRVDSDLLPSGDVSITCSVTAELVADLFWKVTISGRSGDGSTVPGTAAIVEVWVAMNGAVAGDGRRGDIPPARTPGALRPDAAGITAVKELVSRFDSDDTDFYRCFRPVSPEGFTIGPDHRLVAPFVEAACRSDVVVAPDGSSFGLTLTADWSVHGGSATGSLVVRLDVGLDGTIRGPTIGGDPFPVRQNL